MEGLLICSLTPHSPWSPKAIPHHTDSYKIPYGNYYFCSFHEGFWCCLRLQNTVHIQKSWLIILLWHAQASFVPPWWMLILSILEERVRSGESKKGNKRCRAWPGQVAVAAQQCSTDRSPMTKKHRCWKRLLNYSSLRVAGGCSCGCPALVGVFFFRCFFFVVVCLFCILT